VKRVRGKNILWLSVIAMLLSVMMVNVGTAPAIKTELYITPDRIPEHPGTLGHIGDEYYMSVNIKEVTDLYGVGFTVRFAPYGKTLTASDVSEGDFMSEGGAYSTAMSYKIDVFAGAIKVGITRLGAVPGASGSGTLMTWKFTVSEAGSCPIFIENVDLVDSNLNIMDYVTFGSSFYGCTADLIRVNMPDGRHIFVGQDGVFNIKARNDGDVPMYVMGRVEFERVEDGRRIRLYAGQTYYGGYLGADPPFTYLYCDGYDGAYSEWTKYGVSPYLDAIEDGNYIESYVADAWDAFYSFEDLEMPYLGIYTVISNVDFYGYTKCTSTDPDVDPYCFTSSGGVDYSFMWCDSMGGSTSWAWTGCRYYFGTYNFPEYYGFPLTDEAVDNMELLLYNYGGADGEWVDALRAKVEFATIIPLYEDLVPTMILPGEEVELPAITWKAVSDHVGKYLATVYLEYSELYPDVGFHFKNTGEKVVTFHFWVEEP
jgi:hypothetical protein